MILDSHYHLDFIEDLSQRQALLSTLSDNQIGLVAQTVLPSTFTKLYNELIDYHDDHFIPSLGFHPWWIASQEQVESELECFRLNLHKTSYIGEIGLDFSPRRLEQASMDLQCQVFGQILQAIRQFDRKDKRPLVLSIHTVRSEDKVLDIVEASGLDLTQVIPILHRFNGTSDQLTRHLRMGGYVSIHPQMLLSKKGRAYIKQIPRDRLLLESDGPSPADLECLTTGNKTIRLLAKEYTETLDHLVKEISNIKYEDAKLFIQENQARLYFGY